LLRPTSISIRNIKPRNINVNQRQMEQIKVQLIGNESTKLVEVRFDLATTTYVQILPRASPAAPPPDPPAPASAAPAPRRAAGAGARVVDRAGRNALVPEQTCPYCNRVFANASRNTFATHKSRCPTRRAQDNA